MTMDCYQHEFETFKYEWLSYAVRLRTQDSAVLRDQLLRCMEKSLRMVLQNTIDTDWMAYI